MHICRYAAIAMLTLLFSIFGANVRAAPPPTVEALTDVVCLDLPVVGGWSYNSAKDLDWHGGFLWMTTDSSGFDSRVHKLTVTDTNIVVEETGDPGRNYTDALAWVGDRMWTGDQFQNQLCKHNDASIYTIDDSFNVSTYGLADGVGGLGSDGTYLYALGHDGSSNYVFKFDVSGASPVLSEQHGGLASASGDLIWDGQYFWKVSGGTNTLECRTADWELVATYIVPFAGTVDFQGLAFDGQYLYILNNPDTGSGKLLRIPHPKTLTADVCLDLPVVGGWSYNSAKDLDWHGGFLWMTTDSSGFDSRVHKLTVTDTNIVVEETGDPGRNYTDALAWVGDRMWTGDQFQNQLCKHNDASIYTIDDSFNVSTYGLADGVGGLGSDGTYLYALGHDGSSNYVFKFDVSGASPVLSEQHGGLASASGDLIWDGQYFWKVSGGTNTLECRTADWELVATYIVPFAGTVDFQGLAFDGQYLYILNNPDTGSGKLLRIPHSVFSVFDADTDGLPDYWERHYLDHLGWGPGDDPDGDGYTLADELASCLDPTQFDIGPMGIYTAIEVTWQSVSGTNYQVQWASSLDTNTWYDLGSPITGTGGEMSVFDSIRSVIRRFYRVGLAE